ncbi:MAG: NAD(P)H-binding protein [Armatimonadetes bacterium]|nr:NAD(P)H-binding protein [Anaerolineae bacterium]
MTDTLIERTPLSLLLTAADSPFGLLLTQRLVAAGHQVAGLTATTDGAAHVRAQGGLPVYADAIRQGELKSLIAMRKVEVVINLSAQAHNHIPLRNAAWDTDALEDTASALIAAASESGAKFYLHTSFAFVYGDHHGAWVDETTRPTPGDQPLLRAALRAEMQARAASIPSCILRLGFLYGTQSPELHALYDALRLNRPMLAGAGIANWVQMEDAAEAIRRAAEARIADGIYNIVDSAPASSAAFLTTFAAGLGLRPPMSIPAFAGRAVLSQHQLDLMKQSVKVRNARAIEELGWTPRFASHVAGLEDTFLSWRAMTVPMIS